MVSVDVHVDSDWAEGPRKKIDKRRHDDDGDSGEAYIRSVLGVLNMADQDPRRARRGAKLTSWCEVLGGKSKSDQKEQGCWKGRNWLNRVWF